VDLSEVDLSEADLSEADLSEADLSEADLSEGDLSEVDPSEEAEDMYLDLDRADLALAWTCQEAEDTVPLPAALVASQASPALAAPSPSEDHRTLSMDLPEHPDHTKTSLRSFQKITNV